MNHQKNKKRTQKNNKLKEDDKKTLANFKQVFGFNDDVLKKINTAHKYAKIYDDQTQCAKRKNTIRKRKMDGGSGQVKLLELAVTIAVPAFFPLGIPLTIAFGIGNRIIFEAIDKLVDNVSMSDSHIATICRLIGWVLPNALVVYMGNFIYHDHQSIITKVEQIDRTYLGNLFKTKLEAIVQDDDKVKTILTKGISDVGNTCPAADQLASGSTNASADLWTLAKRASPNELASAKMLASGSTNASAAADLLASGSTNAAAAADLLASGSTNAAADLLTLAERASPNELASAKLLAYSKVNGYKLGATDVPYGYNLGATDVPHTPLSKMTFQYWYELASDNPKTSGIVLTSVVVAYMGYYLYTRMLRDLEENVRLDENLYMNHRRRKLILKGQQQRFDELTENTKKIQEDYKNFILDKKMGLSNLSSFRNNNNFAKIQPIFNGKDDKSRYKLPSQADQRAQAEQTAPAEQKDRKDDEKSDRKSRKRSR